MSHKPSLCRAVSGASVSECTPLTPAALLALHPLHRYRKCVGAKKKTSRRDIHDSVTKRVSGGEARLDEDARPSTIWLSSCTTYTLPRFVARHCQSGGQSCAVYSELDRHVCERKRQPARDSCKRSMQGCVYTSVRYLYDRSDAI